jgi:hypothetical protein
LRRFIIVFRDSSLGFAFLANMTENAVIVFIAEEVTIWAGRKAAVDAKEVSAETAVRPLASLFAVWSAGIIMPHAVFYGFKYIL